VKIDYTVRSIPSHNLITVNVKTRSNVTTLIKLKRDKMATITLCKLKVEEMYFIFNLKKRRLSIKSHAQQKPKYLSEMSETRWPHTLHISLNQKKLDGSVFQTGESDLGR
jgi:hypothetical protein